MLGCVLIYFKSVVVETKWVAVKKVWEQFKVDSQGDYYNVHKHKKIKLICKLIFVENTFYDR